MSLLDFVKPDDLSKVARLQFLAKQVVEGYTSGRHRSPQKGFSVEFKEHRPYIRGDEVRNIDWQAFAKSDRLYIRQFEEETNLHCTLLVDCSGSMQYAGDRSGPDRAGGFSKHDYARLLAASIGYLLLSQQDSVGAVTFDNQIRGHVPPQSRPSHLMSLMQTIARNASQRETDLGSVFRKIAPKLGRRGVLVIFSDAMSDIESLSRALALFRSHHHEVIFFQILDLDEIDFPFQGRIQFRDLENENHERIVEAQTLRQSYLQRLSEHRSDLRRVCRNHRVDLHEVVTHQAMIEVLHRLFSSRSSATFTRGSVS